MGGSNINPDSQGTLEEMITGMADYEYVIEVLSTPGISGHSDRMAEAVSERNDCLVQPAAGNKVIKYESVYSNDVYG